MPRMSKERMDEVSELERLGFVRVKKAVWVGDTKRDAWVKQMRFCNSDCVGCEYCLDLMVVHLRGSGRKRYLARLYKPLKSMVRNFAGDELTDIPFSGITVEEYTSGEEMSLFLMKMRFTVALVADCMDFQQVSGFDLVDVNKAKRGEKHDVVLQEWIKERKK